MQKKSWQPYIERLKQNPQDAEALQALEQSLEASSHEVSVKQRAEQAGRLGRFGVKMFLGKQLYRAVVDGWDAWSAYFQGHYSPRTQMTWPEHETRDISAAVANRFLRIGMFGILIGLIPAIILGFQTALMLIQVWQVNVQNDIVREQNTLTRQQFAVGYSTQLKQQIYAGECTDRMDARSCKPTELPGVRADAAQALVRLADIAKEGDPTTDADHTRATRARLKGALLQSTDLAEMNFDRVDLDGASFAGASLWKTSFEHASLERVDFDKARVDDAIFTGATLTRASLDRTRVTGATFQKADLRGASFKQAIVKASDFSQATFYPDDKPVLRDQGQVANFYEAEALSDLKFDGANLIKANFSQKSWLRLSFVGSKLMQASFAGASLTSSSFQDADLTGANLDGATLIDVDLTGAKLAKAKTTNLKLKNVTCPDGKKGQNSCTFR